MLRKETIYFSQYPLTVLAQNICHLFKYSISLMTLWNTMIKCN